MPDATSDIIRRVLDVSTSHLPPYGTNLNGIEGLIVYELAEYGWLVWVPDDPEQHAADYLGDDEADYSPAEPEIITRELIDLQKYARERGCDYILFDRDGPTNANLHRWDW